MFSIGPACPEVFEREAAKLDMFGVWRVLGLVKPLGFPLEPSRDTQIEVRKRWCCSAERYMSHVKVMLQILRSPL